MNEHEYTEAQKGQAERMAETILSVPEPIWQTVVEACEGCKGRGYELLRVKGLAFPTRWECIDCGGEGVQSRQVPK